MRREEVSRLLREHFHRLRPGKGAPPADDADLGETLLLDSLDIVETVVFLEKTFRVALSSADINAGVFRSVSTLADLVLERSRGRRC